MKNFTLSTLAILLVVFGSIVAANAQTDDKVYERGEVDKRVEFLTKPRPNTGGRCERRTRGTIVVEAIFHRSGAVEVTGATQLSGCTHFDDNALEVTKSITFNPAIKDGQPVSVKMPIMYSYSVY